ncbi:MAG: hypothetical protein OZ913_02590 [Ignavibacteriaceae bacterium]|nr:hypothetical protein [Ignavibacteriaceae bacterium]
MKKQLILILAVVLVGMSSLKSEAQLISAPDFTIGLTLHGNLATNEFTGQMSGAARGENYGALWGRGIGLHAKFGLDKWKNNRLTVGVNYDQFTNSSETGKSFFTTIPSNIPYTSYTMIGGSIGYEYVFGARCKNRPYIGLGVNGTMIQTDAGNNPKGYENAFRIGFELVSGVEFTFGDKSDMAFNLAGKYKLINPILNDNDNTPGNLNLNDGDGQGGSNYIRFIGWVGLELGMNFNFGSKPLTLKR